MIAEDLMCFYSRRVRRWFYLPPTHRFAAYLTSNMCFTTTPSHILQYRETYTQKKPSFSIQTDKAIEGGGKENSEGGERSKRNEGELPSGKLYELGPRTPGKGEGERDKEN